MSLNCAEVKPMIAWLLDNELDPAQSEEVQAHLETCASCRRALQADGQLRRALRRATASIDTPMSLRHKVRESMQQERRSQTGLARAWPAAMAAAILLSFVWQGKNAATLLLSKEVTPAPQSGEQPMQTTTPDVGRDGCLGCELQRAVHLPTFVAPDPAATPLTNAAHIVSESSQKPPHVVALPCVQDGMANTAACPAP